MKTENISTLKIHKLTQEQYDRELAAGRIDETALYLTPDEENDSFPIENSIGENSLQQTLNREVFTVANENINESTDVNKNEAGEIISGAIGAYSSIFGGSAQAKGKRSMASGSNTVALGGYSHAEGNETFAGGTNSHAEGLLTSSLGVNSHAEGENSVAEGAISHAEGANTLAKGVASHAEGVGTVAASESQHVQGAYNEEDSEGKYVHIVGNGNSENPHNAHTVTWSGDAWYAGNVYVGGNNQSEGKKLLTNEDIYGEHDLINFEVSANDFIQKTVEPEDGATFYIYEYPAAISAAFEGKNIKIIVKDLNSNSVEYSVENDNVNYQQHASTDDQILQTIDSNDIHLFSGASFDNFFNSTMNNTTPMFENNLFILANSLDNIQSVRVESYNSISKIPQKYIENIEHINDVPVVTYEVTTYNELCELFNKKGTIKISELDNVYEDCKTVFLKDKNDTLLGIYSHTGYSSNVAEYCSASFYFLGFNGKKYMYLTYSASHGHGGKEGWYCDDLIGVEATNYYTNSIHQKFNIEAWANSNQKINEYIDQIQKDTSGNIKVGAYGKYSAAFNGKSQAKGEASFVEGGYNVAFGKHSHAEGEFTFSKGDRTHTEGLLTSAIGDNSHAEGTVTVAEGYSSHAEGESTEAKGGQSHAEGLGTKASGSVQHVQGKYNIEDTENKYAHIVGNGNDSDNRSNAHTVDWDGNAWYKGDVYVGGTAQDVGKKLATEEYVTSVKDSIALRDVSTGQVYNIRINNGVLEMVLVNEEVE